MADRRQEPSSDDGSPSRTLDTRRTSARDTVRLAVVIGALGVVFGDSMITPAISVLSAVEGLKVVEPSLEDAVVPITAVIIVILFLVQRRGTAAVVFQSYDVEILLSPPQASKANAVCNEPWAPCAARSSTGS
ncbi:MULTISPECIES: KUP/HAK/KT family potassium transporter [unclassified Streptomyces]|uniref:KUP/HAK/KT family potassium transporter n=1 Tax=unclassified Streptomyces TaxID=2593676 RepID=UPI002259766D|nr:MULTISPECIES: KUP/HAK/KT family potassium transporter [unclassified Streptomyces]MCX5435358.1 KUP/HAK/KT family potassium transporter [Streptomyces sp. NBC_00063]WSE13147.1 KUP/HAK/KT family potassium transporter [Streptomyces sp. NBC_01397]WUB97934.1 KUP/HAK/KT family potassium transporter [Streptomyces sp. NBC_00569]